MPTPTYIPLATVTLGSSASSVTFSSIPATYRDLVLVLSGSTSALASLSWRANGDSGTNYSWIQAGQFSGSPFSNAFSSQTSGVAGISNTSSSTVILQIMDYSATDKHKTSLSRSGMGGVDLVMQASRYQNTSAITSVQIAGGTFSVGTTFSLYGIAS